MPISILHVGLPFDYPSIPPEERPKVTKRVTELRQRMRDAGYDYNIFHVSPESGLGDFRNRLKAQPCDGVLIGGGVLGNPELLYFLEQIVDAVHEVTPKARIMFFNHSEDVRETVERWFPSPSA